MALMGADRVFSTSRYGRALLSTQTLWSLATARCCWFVSGEAVQSVFNSSPSTTSTKGGPEDEGEFEVESVASGRSEQVSDSAK